MYSSILVAIDGSPLSNNGLLHGLALAKALGAKVTILTASEPWTPIGVDATGFAVAEYSLLDEYEKATAAASQGILATAEQSAKAAGVEYKAVYVSSQHPADAILDYAAKNGIDLIVMASHGRRGLERVLLGSQTNEVLTRSSVPVLVVR